MLHQTEWCYSVKVQIIYGNCTPSGLIMTEKYRVQSVVTLVAEKPSFVKIFSCVTWDK